MGFAAFLEIGLLRQGGMRFVETDRAPKAVGHYSQAVQAGGFLFLSGQIAIDPKTNASSLFGGDVGRQTALILENVRGILESQGLKPADVVRASVFLSDIGKFSEFDRAYAEFFGPHKPARAVVGVAGLPRGADIEIEIVATFSETGR